MIQLGITAAAVNAGAVAAADVVLKWLHKLVFILITF